MELTVDSFNFGNMVDALGKDPFASDANKYAEDTRFYKLTKDKEGNGGSVIRFLPDKNKNLIVQVNKINTSITKNGKKRFVNELSPARIGLPCPFFEEWQRLWNADRKEESRKFNRSIRYYANIKVLKDPANPANEGKIFILDMSGTLKDKIQKLLKPSETDIALGSVPYELFNPLRGNSFRYLATKGSNDITDYSKSDVVTEVNSIYSTPEEAFKDIMENTHDLSEFLQPSAYLSYEELKKKLAWVTFSDSVAPVATVETVSAVKPTSEINSAQETPVSQVSQVSQPVQETPVSPAPSVDTVQPTTTTAPQTSGSFDIDELMKGIS